MPLPHDLCSQVQNGFRLRRASIAVPHTTQNLAILGILLREGFYFVLLAEFIILWLPRLLVLYYKRHGLSPFTLRMGACYGTISSHMGFSQIPWRPTGPFLNVSHQCSLETNTYGRVRYPAASQW